MTILLERDTATTPPQDPLIRMTGDDRSDASLVVAMARYDERALATIYERHGGAVFALARRLVRNRVLAEEVTQEIFLRLWNRPERFDPDRGTLRAFLLADTHGRSIDMLRSELARRDRETREGRLAPTPVRNDPESEALNRVASQQIRDALQSLTDDERRAIELAYFGGYTYREVAVALGQPEGTVKSRIRAGMKRLRTELAAAGMVAP
jgi:RNA polymerase sigma-70 factor (ECF subfamily)